jgi:hypothetical protein
MERFTQKFWLNMAILTVSAVGFYDILSDLISGGIHIQNLIINSLFFAPLFFRNKLAFFFYGLSSILFGAFIVLGSLTVMIQMVEKYDQVHNKLINIVLIPLFGVCFIICGAIFLKNYKALRLKISNVENE